MDYFAKSTQLVFLSDWFHWRLRHILNIFVLKFIIQVVHLGIGCLERQLALHIVLSLSTLGGDELTWNDLYILLEPLEVTFLAEGFPTAVATAFAPNLVNESSLVVTVQGKLGLDRQYSGGT